MVCFVTFNYLVIALFSVGTKESGTRHLSYFDAVLGFRHLLQQADLDRALSLCTGMRGKLKSRFVVLSDDRVLPPPPIREPRGKRKQDSDPDGNAKRGRGKRTPTPVPKSTKQPTPQPSRPSGASATSDLSQVSSGSSHPGYFTSGGPVPGVSFIQRLINPFPAIPEAVAEGSSTSSGTSDWASANSDDTTLQ